MCDEIARSEKERSADVTQIREETNSLIAGFNEERMAMAKELRKKLTMEQAELRKETDALLTEFRSEQKQFRKDLAEAFYIWQKFTKRSATFLKRPAMKGITKSPSHTVPEAFSGHPIEVTIKPPETTKETKETLGEGEKMEEKIIAALSEKKGGLTFDDLSEKLNISASRLGRTLKKLIEEGKIERKGQKHVRIVK